jgi:hypothetical protein
MTLNGRLDAITPWEVIVDTDEQTISVRKRNKILVGVDEDTLAFRYIRRVTIDEHLVGADITIKAVGGSLTAYSLDKSDCKRIKQILMDYNQTRRSSIVFS